MKHIVIVIDQFQSGGAPAVVKTLALTLINLGYKITIIVLSERLDNDIRDIFQLALPYKPRNIISRWFRYHEHAKLLDRLLDSFENIDLILSHLYYSHQVLSRSKFIEKTWLCVHSTPSVELLSNINGIGRLLKNYKTKKLYSNKKIIGVSNGIINDLTTTLQIKPKRALTIYNSVDAKRIRELSTEPLDLDIGPYFLYVGRISMRQKRYDRLLFAYKKSGTPLPLVIVGGGELDQIKIQIDKLDLKNKVILIGANSNPYKFMKHATALLLSSDYEGLPTVIIEAFICGIPVISTDCPSGPSELLLKDQKRFLVPLDDIDAFAEAINSIIKTPPKIPLALLDKFHPSNVANQYIMLCKER